jgi:hypothetical protein
LKGNERIPFQTHTELDILFDTSTVFQRNDCRSRSQFERRLCNREVS